MDERILNIVARVLAGEADANDRQTFDQWMSLSDDNKHRFKQLSEYWNIQTGIRNAETPQEAFEKFKAKRAAATTFKPKKKMLQAWTWRAAAAVAALIVGTVFINIYIKNKDSVEYHTVTSLNDVYQLTLPDNTLVHLNRNSTITYNNMYGKNNRDVEIQGEAYFAVAKNETAFRLAIANSDVVIEVLGTEFNVKAYADDPEIVTTLREGAVMFSDGKQQVVIAPDQQLTYNKTTYVAQLTQTDADWYIAWKNEIYRFSQITFRELCNRLEKIHNIEISISSQKLKDISVSGAFEFSQSIDEILNIMKIRINFEWTKEEDKIVIKE